MGIDLKQADRLSCNLPSLNMEGLASDIYGVFFLIISRRLLGPSFQGLYTYSKMIKCHCVAVKS